LDFQWSKYRELLYAIKDLKNMMTYFKQTDVSEIAKKSIPVLRRIGVVC
tara:strand:- start:17566 stop:17712 length:147 start_codon:yes stop_codon:yes gene_type:complete